MTGILTATTFSGSGANLSNIPGSAITGLDARPNFQTAEYTARTTFTFTHNYTAVPNLSCVITPSSSNSKILVQVMVM